MKATIVIPTINEEACIGVVLDKIPKDENYEVLIIDSDSTDKTVEIAESRGARVINEKRRGYGRAYKTGFENAQGDIIVTLDADDTYPAERIHEFVAILEKQNLDFISCDRISTLEKGVMSRTHILGNKILTLASRVLFGAKIKDSQTGMWIFKKVILNTLDLTSDGMGFSEEIKIEAIKKGFKFKEMPIKYRRRLGEVKLNTWRDGWLNLKFLFKKRF